MKRGLPGQSSRWRWGRPMNVKSTFPTGPSECLTLTETLRRLTLASPGVSANDQECSSNAPPVCLNVVSESSS